MKRNNYEVYHIYCAIMFFNDFKPGIFSATANAETILNITLRKRSGAVTYSKTIFGFGEEQSCFITGGKNASLALEKSLFHAVQRLMDDTDFLRALLGKD